jgi:hypothetical protein
MRPPLIYPQLSHFNNHGLAISSEKKFLKSVFLLVYHLNPQVLKETEHWKKGEREKVLEKREKKEKGEERKRKAPRVSSNKKEKSIFWEEKNIASSKFFLCESIFSPSIIPFSKPFQIVWESFIALFGPSFNLAICMTWVVFFVFTHELHIFSF